MDKEERGVAADAAAIYGAGLVIVGWRGERRGTKGEEAHGERALVRAAARMLWEVELRAEGAVGAAGG